jgi:hypothetical protein
MYKFESNCNMVVIVNYTSTVEIVGPQLRRGDDYE